jgi:hypothetical protein
VSAPYATVRVSRDKENKMAKYVVEGWNEVAIEVVEEDGEVWTDTQMQDSISVFFTNKARAEKFRAGLSLSETFITAYDWQCGCLEEGNTCEGFGETAYCSWCI